MICAVHQPNYIPYLGFFNKIKKSDIFVFYDSAQYTKNDFTNRNRVKIANGPAWLTIPVSVSLGQLISEVRIANPDFRSKHLRTLEMNYKKSLNFDEIFPKLEKLFVNKTASLLEFNVSFLNFFISNLFPKKKIYYSSQLNLDTDKKSTAALLDILDKVGADTYLSGQGARHYLDESLFASRGKKLIWQEFHHPIYNQLWGEFLPNLSIVDMIFNVPRDEWINNI